MPNQSTQPTSSRGASTIVERLADFVSGTSLQEISEPALRQLKLRILDSLGCAFGALDGEPVRVVRSQVREFGGSRLATMIGGGRGAPDRAALYNGTLVRYLDFSDSYLAPGETCHPSDNFAPVLAACEYSHADGATLLTALATAYQVQCRLCELAPVRAKGFDHTTLLAYSVAAGVSRALGLDPAHTANALAIAGASLNALRVTRTGELSNWKGLAAPFAASSAASATFLAMRGMTGPREVFEGNKGFIETISRPPTSHPQSGTLDKSRSTGSDESQPASLDHWDSEGLDSVTHTILKRYNAEVHSQSAIEALLTLRDQHSLTAADVSSIELDTFQVAYDIIGGGEEGSKHRVSTKEEADHSLPYLLAVALLDGQVLPEQYAPDRISAADVQQLMGHVTVRPDPALSALFPDHHPARLTVHLTDGKTLRHEQHDYQGFHTNPMTWNAVATKFDDLASPHTTPNIRHQLKQTIADLDHLPCQQLADLLLANPHINSKRTAPTKPTP